MALASLAFDLDSYWALTGADECRKWGMTLDPLRKPVLKVVRLAAHRLGNHGTTDSAGVRTSLAPALQTVEPSRSLDVHERNRDVLGKKDAAAGC